MKLWNFAVKSCRRGGVCSRDLELGRRLTHLRPDPEANTRKYGQVQLKSPKGIPSRLRNLKHLPYRVLRTRDVKIDESARYKPQQEELRESHEGLRSSRMTSDVSKVLKSV